ncbi:MAG: AMP-binding protein [Deltaproteobacteria bacterium]|nr:AMP-binding protein [Deltaproteobacteria bacterium]
MGALEDGESGGTAFLPDRQLDVRAAVLSHRALPQPKVRTVAELITKWRRDDHADPLTFIDTQSPNSPLAIDRLLDKSERFASALLSRGLGAGDRVLLLLPSGEEFVAAFFGALMARTVPVPCVFPVVLGDPKPLLANLAPIVASARPRLLITLPQVAGPAAESIMSNVGGTKAVLIPEMAHATPRAASLPEIDENDLALIQYTSGPLGEPTGVALTHNNILANIDGIASVLRLSDADIALTWVPLVHDMGLIGMLLTSFYARAQLFVMPPQVFLMRPHAWLRAISDLRATLSAAPNAAYQLCVRRVTDRHMEGLDLSSWRLALNGSEFVQATTVDAFAEKFGRVGFRRSAFYPLYGLAENALAATCPDLERAFVVSTSGDGATPVVGVGRPIRGQEVAIVNDAGEVAREREVGEIIVRGPSVMRGYFNNEPATARVLSGGWLYTGDLGFIEHGQLFVVGRKKEMVIKVGRNYYPRDIEEAAESVAALEGGRALAFASPSATEGTEDLVLIVESRALDEAARRQLTLDVNGALLANVGIRADRVVPIPPGRISGASHRAAIRGELRREFGDGRLA